MDPEYDDVSMRKGDRRSFNKFLRWRVAAQGLTVIAALGESRIPSDIILCICSYMLGGSAYCLSLSHTPLHVSCEWTDDGMTDAEERSRKKRQEQLEAVRRTQAQAHSNGLNEVNSIEPIGSKKVLKTSPASQVPPKDERLTISDAIRISKGG